MNFDEDYYRSGNYINYADRKDRYQRTAVELLRFLEAIGFRSEESILDFGCGLGFMVSSLNHLGAIARGYETSEFAIKELELAGIPIDKTLVYREVMIALDVFEHMEDDDIRACIRKVEPRIMILRIPVSLDGKQFALEVSRNDPTHINCKVKHNWVNMMRGEQYAVRQLRLFTVYDTPGVACLLCIR